MSIINALRAGVTAVPVAVGLCLPTPASAADFWGSISGIPVSSHVMTLKVLNRINGKYPDSNVYLTFNGQTHSIAEKLRFG